MQIKSIILYNTNGERRILNFRSGQVNIITGESRTGKSTIINIVDYCMGRSSFNIPEGPIRQSVEYYAVLFYLNDVELFVAKPKPPGDGRSSNQVYYRIGKDLSIPSIQEIAPFSNDTDLIEVVSKRLGIHSNKAGEDTENRDFEVTVDHTKFYLFQPENYIKNQDALFYRQIEEGLAKHIRTTLPYILGAVEDESLQLSIELRQKQRDLLQLKRTLSESEVATIERATRGKSLLSEAVQVGMIDESQVPTDAAGMLRLIRQIIADWKPDEVSSQSISNQLPALRQKETEIRRLIQEQQEQIVAAQAYIASANGYESEASQQVVRLVSVGLFDDDEQENTCPVCSSKLDQPIASTTSIRNQLQKLDSELNLVGREKPKLDTYLEELNTELKRLQERRKQIQFNIKSVIDEQESADSISDDRIRTARIIGRMSWFLDTNPPEINEITELRRLIESTQREVDLLSERLDSLSVEERLDSILDNIDFEMTTLAKELELEHQYPYKLNPKRLTVTISVPGSPIEMGKNLGSGSNYLGVHLITFLALHKYFIEQGRPVPNFIIFDQPSQVYFPEQTYTDDDGVEQEPEDLQAVIRMFNLFFSYCRNLNPNLQIIILEHAEFEDQEFRDALVEEPWRNGRALIPAHWI